MVSEKRHVTPLPTFPLLLTVSDTNLGMVGVRFADLLDSFDTLPRQRLDKST
jgi:hypothetical protein